MEGGYDARMKVRIGISNTDRLIELEISDAKAFKKEIERALEDGSLGWFTDTKGRSIGIPAKNFAFIEMDDPNEQPQVGFAPTAN
jgi:hypothetical protein